MHEMSLLNDLMRKINHIAAEQNANSVTHVTLRLGALAHISPDHLKEHFEEAASGTLIEGAELEIIANDDIKDPFAQDILLESVDVAVVRD